MTIDLHISQMQNLTLSIYVNVDTHSYPDFWLFLH